MLFQKDGSSLGSGAHKKKTMDVPLRKSDKRQLQAKCMEYFGIIDKNNNTSEHQLLQQSKVWSHIFTHGNIWSRRVALGGDTKDRNNFVVLYSKSGNGDFPKTEPSSSTTTPTQIIDQWPYQITQVILIEMDAPCPGGSVPKRVCLPTLALLSVLYSEAAGLPGNYSVNVLPTISVHAGISKPLCRGADLMRSGVFHLPQFSEEQKQNQIVAINVSGNPQPFAMGFLTNNTSEATIGVGSQGVAVQIVTSYGDDLWRQQVLSLQQQHQSKLVNVPNPMGGGNFNDGNYGNAGFIDGKVVLALIQQESNDASDCEPVKQQKEEEATEGNGSLDANGDSAVPLTIEGVAISESGACANKAQEGMEGGTVGKEKEEENDIDRNNPDDVLHASVCKALASLSKSQLPMTTATFYAQHVLPNRPEGTTIQLKQTSYKKLGPYLAVQAKRGLLTTDGKSKSNPMEFITGVNRRHEDVKQFVLANRSDSNARSENGDKKKLAIVTLYVVPHQVAELLRLDPDAVKAVHARSEARRGTGFLTVPEVRALLESYLTAEELISPMNPEQAQLDGPLTSVLFKKVSDPPTHLARKDLSSKWMSKMDVGYALVEMPRNNILNMKRGTPPKILVEVEMRSGKKFITRVRGLEEYGINGEQFAKDVSKRFACSASVEVEAPQGRPALKKGQVEVIFQGHLLEELRALLLGDERISSHGGAKGGDYCVPKGVIEAKLKKGVPIKKKK